MKKEDLMDALGSIDEKYLIEADAYRNTHPFSKKPILTTWLTSAIICMLLLCISIYVLSFNTRQQGQHVAEPVILPQVTLNDETLGGFGYQVLEYQSPFDIVNGNPWDETVSISSLPVFRNQLSYNEQHMVSGYSLDDMKEKFYDIADRLNLPSGSFQIQIDRTPYSAVIQAETDDYQIAVYENMDAKIILNAPPALPESLRFLSLHSYEENMAVAEYLLSTYADLIDMQDPQIAVSGGYCRSDGTKQYWISFFDKGKTIKESMLNYNFHTIDFYVIDGQLKHITFHHSSFSSEVGDYPIISVDEAEKLLRNGNYIAFFPPQLIKENFSIVKCDLIYRMEVIDTYFVPYYCFYIELDQEAHAAGATSYGLCYVPAISSEYIETMPVNGSLSEE